jgi:hemin uptake protein HemP
VSAPQADARRSPSSSVREARRIASEQLMAGKREIIIEHGQDEYRLRITGSGKLILTK